MYTNSAANADNALTSPLCSLDYQLLQWISGIISTALGGTIDCWASNCNCRCWG